MNITDVALTFALTSTALWFALAIITNLLGKPNEYMQRLLTTVRRGALSGCLAFTTLFACYYSLNIEGLCPSKRIGPEQTAQPTTPSTAPALPKHSANNPRGSQKPSVQHHHVAQSGAR